MRRGRDFRRAELWGLAGVIIFAVDKKFTIIYEPAEEGGFTAFIPEVPGAISEGETIEEAREMVLDALRELSECRRETAIEAKTPGAVVEAIAI